MFILFLSTVFPDSFFFHVVATTVCTTEVHTLTCRTHIFLLHSVCARSHTFVRVTYTHGSSVCKKVFAHASLISPSRLLPSHVSPVSAVPARSRRDPDYDFTDSDIHKFLPYFPVLKAQDMRNSAPASRCLATWPSQMQTQKHDHHLLLPRRPATSVCAA